MTFVKMGKLMTESWKTIDPFAKDVFCELALEGKLVYRQLMDEYHASSKTLPLPPGGGKKPAFIHKPSLKSPPVLHESKHAPKIVPLITTKPRARIVSPSVMPSLVHVPSSRSRMTSLSHDVSTSTSAEDNEELPFLPTSVSTEENDELPFLPTYASTEDDEELPFLSTSVSTEDNEELPFLLTTASSFEEDEALLCTDVASWRMMSSLASSLPMHVRGVAPLPIFTPSKETGYEIMSDSIFDAEMEALHQQGISVGDFMTFVMKLAEE